MRYKEIREFLVVLDKFCQLMSIATSLNVAHDQKVVQALMLLVLQIDFLA